VKDSLIDNCRESKLAYILLTRVNSNSCTVPLAVNFSCKGVQFRHPDIKYN